MAHTYSYGKEHLALASTPISIYRLPRRGKRTEKGHSCASTSYVQRIPASFSRQYKTNELRQFQTCWLHLPLQFLMGFLDVSEHSLPGVCQPHFTAAFMLLVLTATQFKWRLGLKSCLFAYLCLFILFVSVHYGKILLFIKPFEYLSKHANAMLNGLTGRYWGLKPDWIDAPGSISSAYQH